MILSVIATLNAWYLTYTAYNPSEASFCDINAEYSCSMTMNTPETQIFGVPFPALALVVYPILFLIALRGRRKKSMKTFTILAILSACGILFNLYFIYQEYLLGTYCPLCLLCSVIIITIFILSILGIFHSLWRENKQT